MYRLIGETHMPNVVLLGPRIGSMLDDASVYGDRGTSTMDYDLEVLTELRSILAEIKESGMREKAPEKYEAAMCKINKMIDDIAEHQKNYDDKETEYERNINNITNEYIRGVTLMEKSQKFEIDTITSTRPEVIYLEGDTLCSLMDKARGVARDFVKRIVLLDKDVPAYLDDDYDPERKTEDREAAWMEKFKAGPGLVIIGADHIDSIKKKLEELGEEVDIIFDARSQVPLPAEG